jgi:hypothetical protein
MFSRTNRWSFALALPLLAAPALAQPLTSAFTYQGELADGGQPSSGAFDFQFRLLDSESGGSQLGPTLCSDDLTVVNGRFAVTLDFGAQFTASQRFLEVLVRHDSGLPCSNASGFTTLSPRQPITAAPNAAFALIAGAANTASTAANAANLNGQPPAFYTNAANLNAGSLDNARLPVPFALTGNVLGSNAQLLNVTNTNPTYGVAVNATANGIGLKATSTATTGVTYGGQFESNSDAGTGLLVTANNGEFGLHSIATGPNSIAVYGEASNSSGSPVGVAGASWSATGIGVAGYGGSHGLLAQSISPGSKGIETFAPADGFAGYFNGRGYFAGSLGIGVTDTGSRPLVTRTDSTSTALFQSTNTTAASLELSNTSSNATWEYAVAGSNPTVGGAGGFYLHRQGASQPALVINTLNETTLRRIFTSSTNPLSSAVTATNSGNNTRAELASDSIFADGAIGVGGFSSTHTGVFGHNGGSGQGVWGVSQGGWGVFGEALTNGVGVRAMVNITPTFTGYGLYASCIESDDIAVHAVGRLTATGTKSFRIDHPLDPANKYLFHYCAESDSPTNFYSGKVTLDDRGEATVTLPPYFAAINKDPRYTLTAIGAPMPLLHIAQEIDEDQLTAANTSEPGDALTISAFRIAGGIPNARVSWRVEATRNDRWVQTHGAPVEQDKLSSEKGTYQHPDLYNAPSDSALHSRPRTRTGAPSASR